MECNQGRRNWGDGGAMTSIDWQTMQKCPLMEWSCAIIGVVSYLTWPPTTFMMLLKSMDAVFLNNVG